MGAERQLRRTVALMIHGRTRRLLLGIAGVLAVGATAVSVLLVDQNSTTRDPQELLSALAICAALDDHDRSSQCFEVEFNRALDSGSLPFFLQTLKDFEAENPQITGPCRAAALVAGERNGAEGDPVAALRSSVTDSMVCSNGFIMGTYQGIATRQPTDDQFRSFVQVCAEVSGAAETLVTTSSKTGCVDGYGHAAWLSHRDVGTSAALCLLLPLREDQGVCIGGLFHAMRLSAPPGSPELSSQRREEYCSAVQDVTGNPELVNACYTGVSLGMTMQAAEYTRSVFLNRASQYGDDVYQSHVAEMRRLWGEVLNDCEQWGEQSTGCHRAVVWELQKLLDQDTELCKAITSGAPYSREDDCSEPVGN